MQLPNMDYPILSITTPNDKKTYTFRPMLVKDEKLLLMAKASEDEGDILTSIKQVVSNCSTDPTFDVNKLPLFALEFVFIKLRGYSIDNVINVKYQDFEDKKIYDFSINLKDVTVKFPESDNKKIAITERSGMIMKYPMATIYDDKKFLSSVGDDSFYRLVVKCIDQLYDSEKVYEAKDFNESELLTFLDQMDIKSFEKVREFMTNLPTLYHRIDYKNSLGNDRSIELTTLSDFFTLR